MHKLIYTILDFDKIRGNNLVYNEKTVHILNYLPPSFRFLVAARFSHHCLSFWCDGGALSLLCVLGYGGYQWRVGPSSTR